MRQGPTGYRLARQLQEQGICCVVVAPSLVPTQQNRRIKTDRRDAVRLAHFLRSGDLVEVSIPEAQTEAMRDLERAREDAVQVERVARQQLDKFLLRHGRRWSEGSQVDGQTLEVDSACKSSPRRPRGVCWRITSRRWSRRRRGSNA